MSRTSVAVQIVMLATLVISGFAVQAEAPPALDATTAWDRVIMEAAFSRVDANNDGTLSKAESSRLAAMADRFDALDVDHDGALNLEEFSVGFSVAL